MSDKRRIQRNLFSEQEELALLLTTEKYTNVIERKAFDKTTISEKSKAWRNIAASFNSKNDVFRSVVQLRTKYSNLKAKARKIIGHNQLCIKGTGGDPAVSFKDNRILEVILRIINKVTVGHASSFDCNVHSSNQGHFLIRANENANHVSSVKNFQINIESEEEGIEEVIEESIYENIANPMKEVRAYKLLDGSCRNISNLVSPKTTSVRNTCTRKKSKTPIIKKLRPVSLNPTKENYYIKKMKLIEEEIKRSAAQKEEIAARKYREQEEHQKKMKLMDLEIKIKEKILR